jgi:DNA-binding HxlR family transcriptional regulator
MSDRSEFPRAAPSLKVDFATCPVLASLGVLGRKWTFLILRNIAVYRRQRFNEMLRITPGLTRRVLTMRLRELRDEGLIEVVERGQNYQRWDLTEKGRDVLPILMGLVYFGSKWKAAEVFEDSQPRTLEDIFDSSYVREVVATMTSSRPPAVRRLSARRELPAAAPRLAMSAD